MENKPSHRPNVILIVADQMRHDCIQAVNPAIRTPNIQRLVENGVLVERAYAPTPVCLPCRASLITGQFPSTHGAMHNESCLPPDYPSNIAREFNRVGYYTHFIGKSHLSSVHQKDSPESPPRTMDVDLHREWKGPWYQFQHADICVGHTTESIAPSMHYRAWLVDHGVDIDRYFGNTAYTAYGAWDLPEEYHNSTWVAEVTTGAIDRAADEGKPFFLFVNFQDPHNPCMVPEPWASMYNPGEIPRHGFKEGEPESFDSKPGFYRKILERKGGYAWKAEEYGLPGPGNVSSLDFDEKQVQENAACYYGMVSLLDKNVGKIIDKVKEKGMLDDTIIIFTSDHGDFLGDHGLWWKSIVSFDEDKHVPLVVSYPAVLPRGERTAAFHSLVDLAPTLLSLAGMEIPPSFEGVDQSPCWKDPAGTRVREFVVVEERPYDTEWCVRHLITDDWRMSFYPGREYGELYDAKADPGMLRNLWDDPAHLGTRLELLGLLSAWEMTKRKPNPPPRWMLLHEILPEQRDFAGFIRETGRVVLDEEGGFPCIELPMSIGGFGRGLFPVPISELVADLEGHAVRILLDGRPVATGRLSMAGHGGDDSDAEAAGEEKVFLEPMVGGATGNGFYLDDFIAPLAGKSVVFTILKALDGDDVEYMIGLETASRGWE